MEKYKFRSTVYMILLIVAILVICLFAWIAIRESKKSITINEKKEVLKESNVNYRDLYYQEASSVVIKAISVINDSSFIDNTFSGSVCKEIHFEVIEDMFTKEAIDKLKAKATLKNNIYVDCNNKFKNNFTGVFNRALTNDLGILSLVSLDYESNTIVLQDDVSLVVLKNVDNKWLIDIF